MMGGSALAQLRAPDAINDLPIKPNPTATVSPICDQLDTKDRPQAIHAACYSEINQAVVVLVSGNADGVSGEQIINHLISRFETKNVPAVGYHRFPEREKAAIVFVLNGDSYGAYSGHNWEEGFEEVWRHAPQAWFR